MPQSSSFEANARAISRIKFPPTSSSASSPTSVENFVKTAIFFAVSETLSKASDDSVRDAFSAAKLACKPDERRGVVFVSLRIRTWSQYHRIAPKASVKEMIVDEISSGTSAPPALFELPAEARSSTKDPAARHTSRMRRVVSPARRLMTLSTSARICRPRSSFASERRPSIDFRKPSMRSAMSDLTRRGRTPPGPRVRSPALRFMCSIPFS
jgi:hypothetical protein